MTVAGVYQWPNDGRDTRLSYAILAPVAPDDGAFSECWARQWPLGGDLDGLLYATVTGGDQAGVTSLNKGFDAHYDPTERYRARLTRWTPLLALGIGLAIGALAVRRRRLEYAGALHSGQSKGAQLLGIALETLVWSLPATLAALALLAGYCARAMPSDAAAVMLAAGRAPAALFAGAVLAALAVGLAVRENQLFAYFKTR